MDENAVIARDPPQGFVPPVPPISGSSSAAARLSSTEAPMKAKTSGKTSISGRSRATAWAASSRACTRFAAFSLRVFICIALIFMTTF
jgi:hypothetical protein